MAEFFIKEWQEADSENNFFLQGNIVAQITQAEQDALNNAYQSGFFIALITPTIDDIFDLHDVLGLEQVIVDNGPIDIFAVSRRLSDSGGVRYYRLYNVLGNQDPRELDFERERLVSLIDWQNTQSAATTSVRGDDSMNCNPTTSNCLSSLASHKLYSETFTVYPGSKFTFQGVEFTEDFKGFFTANITAISAHSVVNAEDFYYIQADYVLGPNTTNKSSPSDSGWPCNPTVLDFSPIIPANGNQKGVNNYHMNNTVGFGNSTPTVQLLGSSPGNVTCDTSTESSISHSIGGDVSYAIDEGFGIGISEGVEYGVSKGANCPGLQIKNDSTTGPLGNNAVWTYPLFETNDAIGTFQPRTQWYLSAQPMTRSQNPCTITEDGKEIKTFCLQLIFDLEVNYYSISCLGTVAPASMSESWKINFQVPPTPPPPTPTPIPTPTPAP